MSVQYSPIKSYNVTSRTSKLNRIIHFTGMCDADKQLLGDCGDPSNNPGQIADTNLLDPNPEEIQNNTDEITENTNYAPDRHYVKSPAGQGPGTDITDPVEELEQDSEEELNPASDDGNYDKPISKEGQYVPSAVVNYNEAAVPGSKLMTDVQKALGTTKKNRTRNDVIKDHVAYNAQFFNTMYYNKDHAEMLAKLEVCDFLEYFYPNVITHNFYTRLRTSCGKLGMNPVIYRALGIRAPLDTDRSKPIGTMRAEISNEISDAIRDHIIITYNAMENWFRADLSSDTDHILYCLQLYSIMSEILLNPAFGPNNLSEDHLNILSTWQTRVFDHYDKMQSLRKYSPDWCKEIQYLHDLCWNFLDDPHSDDAYAECVAAFATEMDCFFGEYDHPQDHTLVTKSDCDRYLIQQLGYDDDLYLIPEKMQYPIINRYSIKLAMDSVNQVEKEFPDDVATFVHNLNQKYKEFGCDFSITPDHPYAKYADKEIVDHMTMILAEGDTAVADTDGASDMGSPNNKTDQPWYKRLDYTGTLYRDGSENKEMGPNTKPIQKPDYTQYDSFL